MSLSGNICGCHSWEVLWTPVRLERCSASYNAGSGPRARGQRKFPTWADVHPGVGRVRAVLGPVGAHWETQVHPRHGAGARDCIPAEEQERWYPACLLSGPGRPAQGNPVCLPALRFHPRREPLRCWCKPGPDPDPHVLWICTGLTCAGPGPWAFSAEALGPHFDPENPAPITLLCRSSNPGT